jgi:hypothetical protein
MGLRVTTESGTVYRIEPGRVMREGGDPLRRDNTWITLLENPVVYRGQPMVLMLEGLADNAVFTQRTTSEVTKIEEYGVEEDGT